MVVSESARGIGGEVERSAYLIFVRPVIAEMIFDLDKWLLIART